MMGTFGGVKKWLVSFPDQKEGLSQYLSQTGEPYVEFLVVNYCRPDDVKIIERMSVAKF